MGETVEREVGTRVRTRCEWCSQRQSYPKRAEMDRQRGEGSKETPPEESQSEAG